MTQFSYSSVIRRPRSEHSEHSEHSEDQNQVLLSFDRNPIGSPSEQASTQAALANLAHENTARNGTFGAFPEEVDFDSLPYPNRSNRSIHTLHKLSPISQAPPLDSNEMIYDLDHHHKTFRDMDAQSEVAEAQSEVAEFAEITSPSSPTSPNTPSEVESQTTRASAFSSFSASTSTFSFSPFSPSKDRWDRWSAFRRRTPGIPDTNDANDTNDTNERNQRNSPNESGESGTSNRYSGYDSFHQCNSNSNNNSRESHAPSLQPRHRTQPSTSTQPTQSTKPTQPTQSTHSQHSQRHNPHNPHNPRDSSQDIQRTNHSSHSSHSSWNKLNAALFVGHALLSAATSVPITLVPTMARSLSGIGDDDWEVSTAYYANANPVNSVNYGSSGSNGRNGNNGNSGVYDGLEGEDTDGSTVTTTTLEVMDGTGTRKGWFPFRIRTQRGNSVSNGSYGSYGSDGSYGSSGSNEKNQNQFNQFSPSSFASHLTVVVTLATALGKFLNGPLADLAGARRILLLYGMGICLSLFGLRMCSTPRGAIGCCAMVEFFSSVVWPCGTVILGAHYGTSVGQEQDGQDVHDVHDGHDGRDGRYERGIYVTSLASRCGSLLAMPLSSLLMKWTNLTWRDVAQSASLVALCGVGVFYLFLTDSPGKVHDPQNPIRNFPHFSSSNGKAGKAGKAGNAGKAGTFASYRPWSPHSTHSHHSTHSTHSTRLTLSSLFSTVFSTLRHIGALCHASFFTILPSLRTVLSSRVFWAVAAAHAGASLVKSSERVLGQYYRDTSFGEVSEGKAGAMSVFLSLGMLGGLLFGGKAFARASEKDRADRGDRGGEIGGIEGVNDVNRVATHLDAVHGESTMMDAATQLRPKNMIAFFYCLSICMCYILSFLAMPFVRKMLRLPLLVLVLQVLASLGLGAGVAVQYYHIPAIVGATFGKNRGLYTAYTDGLASLVSSVVWRTVGGAVEEGNPQGGGWAYGWAAVALLLVFCGTLMVGIMEVYFVGGGWRHHDVHKDPIPDDDYPREILKDGNGSWMEDEMDGSSFQRYGGFHISSTALPVGALQYLSPSRPRRKEYMVLNNEDSIDVKEARNDYQNDLLGIDDDGSILLPIDHTRIASSSNSAENFDPFAPDSTPKMNHTMQSQHHIEFNDGQLRNGDGGHGTLFGADATADYTSFNHIFGAQQGEYSIRESSTFDDPRSTVGSDVMKADGGPPPVDTFSL